MAEVPTPEAFVVPISYYDAFMRQNGLYAQVTVTGSVASLPGGNPAGSDATSFPAGEATLLEYAIGGRLPTIAAGPGGSITLSVHKNLPADDVEFAIEGSIDLVTWDDASSLFTAAAPVSLGDGTASMEFTSDLTNLGTRRYFRLRASLR